MKKIFFDAGPLITLSMCDLLGNVKKLKDIFDGEFYITPKVKREVVDKPLTTRKFKFEAIKIQRLIDNGIIKIYNHPKLEEKTQEILNLAGKCFSAKGHYIDIIHFGEVQVLAAAILENAEAIAIDERTTRVLIESPKDAGKRLEKKLHSKVVYDLNTLKTLHNMIRGVKVLRSTELISVCFEKGFLDGYISKRIKNPKKELLDGLLWALKLAGCAISEREIAQIIKLESKIVGF